MTPEQIQQQAIHREGQFYLMPVSGDPVVYRITKDSDGEWAVRMQVDLSKWGDKRKTSFQHEWNIYNEWLGANE